MAYLDKWCPRIQFTRIRNYFITNIFKRSRKPSYPRRLYIIRAFISFSTYDYFSSRHSKFKLLVEFHSFQTRHKISFWVHVKQIFMGKNVSFWYCMSKKSCPFWCSESLLKTELTYWTYRTRYSFKNKQSISSFKIQYNCIIKL